jgi:hypothetical protein
LLLAGRSYRGAVPMRIQISLKKSYRRGRLPPLWLVSIDSFLAKVNTQASTRAIIQSSKKEIAIANAQAF